MQGENTPMSSDQVNGDQQQEPASSDGELSLSKDDAFHVLQNPRRRAVLRYLLEHPDKEQFRMRKIAEEVAAWECDKTISDLTSTERQRVYIALYQSHLPHLDKYDIIEYDRNRGTVRPTQLVDALAPFLGDGLHAASDSLSVDNASKGETDTSDGIAGIFDSFLRG